MKHCPNCDVEKPTYVELGADLAPIEKCVACMFVHRTELKPLVKAEPRKLAPVADADVDIVDLARRRLAALRTEIAALEKLKREAARLELMIEAADALDLPDDHHPEH